MRPAKRQGPAQEYACEILAADIACIGFGICRLPHIEWRSQAVEMDSCWIGLLWGGRLHQQHLWALVCGGCLQANVHQRRMAAGMDRDARSFPSGSPAWLAHASG